MVFTWDWRLKPVIVKNMKSNRNRNSKTAVMFAMCLAFLMFGGCYTSLSVEIIQALAKAACGADLFATRVMLAGEKLLPTLLDEGPIS